MPLIEENRFPLTALTEEEHLFQQTVASFADEAIRPHVRRMDEEGVFDSGIIRQFFHLGLMGIEIPVSFGGSGSSFFMAILARHVLEFENIGDAEFVNDDGAQSIIL